MKILAFSNNTGSVYWRLESIANYLNSRTEHEMVVANSKQWEEDTLGADIVVAQMWRNPKGIDVCHEQGAKVVYEADDIVIGVGGGERKTLMDLDEKQTKQTIETIEKSDLVTVTTEKLAEHYRQFNKNVVVLPNYLDFLWWGKPIDVKRRGSFRIGWMGSISHREDLIMIEPVIKEITEKYDFVKFIYCGTGGKQGIYGENLFESINPFQREYVQGVPIEYWPMKSKTLSLDIGIAPLLDDEFNSGKSPIKYFEYSANGVPGVYSDTCVYSETVKHGATGYLAKSDNDWFRYIEKLILHDDIRLQIQKDAYIDVFENYNLDDHFKEWVQAYESTSSDASKNK